MEHMLPFHIKAHYAIKGVVGCLKLNFISRFDGKGMTKQRNKTLSIFNKSGIDF